MVRSIANLSFAVLFFAFIVPAQASQVLTNGNFDLGLTGWTSYTTSKDATISEIPSAPPNAPQPQNASVTSFNVTGTGASDALFLNAGGITSGLGQQGGGAFQSFTTTGGLATFSTDIAAFTRTGNLSLGIFSVLLDGLVMDTFDFADGVAGATERSTLDFTQNLTAGTHEIRLLVTRPFGPGRGVNAQYFDNVSLDVTAAVPEPSTWAMVILGFAGVGFMAYRRRKGAMIAA
jgi:hypothetical protein